MGFDSLLGQPTARATLERALNSDRVHHAYRFEGPEGVGKEHAALLLCQALLCPNGGCGACNTCQRALSFSDEPPHVPAHPDLLLVERGLYSAQTLGGSSETSGISVQQIRRIVLPRMGFPPHEGRALCIIVRRAEEMTMAAANALLKTLEEPPPKTHFILVTSRPGKLLDTIVSRSLAVRFAPLAPADLKTLLLQEGIEPSAETVELAEGSLERARELSTPELREARADFLAAADAALEADHVSAALDFADARASDRDGMRAQLAQLAHAYARRARQAETMAAWAARHREVLKAMDQLERNGSPALVLESLMTRLRAC